MYAHVYAHVHTHVRAHVCACWDTQEQKRATIEASSAMSLLRENTRLRMHELRSNEDRQRLNRRKSYLWFLRARRQWKLVRRRLLHERALWAEPSDRTFWKLNSTENSNRMRHKLKRNWSGHVHHAASVDALAGAPPSTAPTYGGVQDPVSAGVQTVFFTQAVMAFC